MNGIICCVLAVVTILIDSISEHQTDDAVAAIKNIDYETIGLLTGLFIVIGGLTKVGVINDFADVIVKIGGDDLFVLYTILVWGSVLISAFVDNIPYVATMLPVLTAATTSLGIEPYLLYFGLLSGATLGGSITPVGASANITGVGMLRKEGYHVSFGQFMRIGIPYTLTAVTVGYIYFWYVWR
jgi:Na+/H+ antiporter NhaD/arsenite permease-like protein